MRETAGPGQKEPIAKRLRRLPENQQFRRQFFPLLLVLLLVLLGTIGYMIVEGWSLGDALYMTIITMSTVGFSEVHHLDAGGRAVTSLLILFGVGVLFFSVTNLWSWIVETQMSGRHSMQQMRNKIDAVERHVIVCGYGRVGNSIADELDGDHIPNVVIEINPQQYDRCLNDNRLVIHGDATQDEVLQAAGIERARGLAIALDDDAKNVFIALTGRALNPQIVIVARSGRRETERKLIHAGAQRVVSPYAMSGQRMAALFTRPNVVDFLDTTLSRGNVEYNLEELTLPETSRLAGLTVQQVDELVGHGITILAIIGSSGLVTSPTAARQIFPRDKLIVIGRSERLAKLNHLAQETDQPSATDN